MKRLVADVYKIIYRLTHSKFISLIFSVSYISALNLIAIYGLALLLSAWYPTGALLVLYRKPYIILVSVVMLGIILWMMHPFDNLYKERKKTPFLPSIIAYTLVAIVVFLYVHYRDRIF